MKSSRITRHAIGFAVAFTLAACDQVTSPANDEQHALAYGPAEPSAAKVWLGLKNSDDVGTKFDLKVEVLRNGSVVSTGQTNNLAGGSSGFNNAILRQINVTVDLMQQFVSGDQLGIRLSVRIAEGVTGHRSGTARLWFNDAAANSRATLAVGDSSATFFLGNTFALLESVGTGPRQTIDVKVDKAVGGNPFKPFGTWTRIIQVPVAGFTLASVTTGDHHACGLTADGTAYCWGRNDFGQLGSGSFSPGSSNQPVLVTGGLHFTSIEASSLGTCALTSDGTAYCWGFNANGALGDGTTDERPAPTAVLTAVRFTQLTHHGGSRCGLATDGKAWCWGRNYGSLPLQAASDFTFQSIYGGGINDCGLTSAKAAYCWGESYGIFDGTDAVAIGGGHQFSSLTIGQFHACGLDLGGLVWCWGGNADGEFGTGTTDDAPDTAPVASAGGMVFRDIRAGELNTCGVTFANVAYCWGDNGSGQIGDGTTTSRLSPVAVLTSQQFATVATGQLFSTCARTAGGEVYCWGSNFFGQIGDGTFDDRLTPTKIVAP